MSQYASPPFAVRKPLRLKKYDYNQCNGYFVTICTHNRLPLFGRIQELTVGATLCGRPNRPDLIAEKWLLEAEKKYTCAHVDYYCVMPDHVHFILFLDSDAAYTLSQIIGWYKSMTTNEYIRGVKSGLYPPFEKQLWQRSYYDHVIRNDIDLRETREYIENNPLNWLLHKNDHKQQ